MMTLMNLMQLRLIPAEIITSTQITGNSEALAKMEEPHLNLSILTEQGRADPELKENFRLRD